MGKTYLDLFVPRCDPEKTKKKPLKGSSVFSFLQKKKKKNNGNVISMLISATVAA